MVLISSPNKSPWKRIATLSLPAAYISILMISLREIFFTKHLKFLKLTLFCVIPVFSSSARMHIWLGIPNGETHSPKPHLDQLAENAAAQPHNRGNSSQKCLLFCSTEEMRQREVEVWGGGVVLKLDHHGNFNNTHMQAHTGKWVSKQRRVQTVICFWRLPSKTDIIDLIRS